MVGVPVEEGRLIGGEVLGTSDGAPNQRFPLAHTGLVLRRTDPAQQPSRTWSWSPSSAGVTDEWTLRETLAFSQRRAA